MARLMIDERSLSQIRLVKSGHPYHIYFNSGNTFGEHIFLSHDGLLRFYYYADDMDFVISSCSSPAIFYEDGSLAWVSDGMYHRTDGPAIIDTKEETTQYWITGNHILAGEYNSHCWYDAEKRSESNTDLMPVVMATVGTLAILNWLKMSRKIEKHTANTQFSMSAKRQ